MRERLEGTDLDLLRYEGTAKSMLIRGKSCGHEFEATYHNLEKAGFKCPVCASQSEKAKRSFEQLIESLDDKYTIEEWIDSTHVRMRHEACGRSQVYCTKTFRNRSVRCPCQTVRHCKQDDLLDLIKEEIGEGVEFNSSDERLLEFGSYGSIHHLLSRLAGAGRIKRTGKGVYIIEN